MAEDNHNQFILRCYEAHGDSADNQSIQVENVDNLDTRVNILDQSFNIDHPSTIQPWQIASYLLQKIFSSN